MPWLSFMGFGLLGFSQTIGAKQSLGWERLLPASALEDESIGFLQGGWMTFIVLISLDGAPALA